MTLAEFEALPLGTIVELRRGKHRYTRVEGGYLHIGDTLSRQVHTRETFRSLFRMGVVRVVEPLELLSEAYKEPK